VASDAAPCQEWAPGLQIVRWVRQTLDEARRAAQALVVLGDGAYDMVEFWRGLPERTAAIVRTARNRRLRQLPEPQGGRGRPRKYRALAPKPAEWLQEAHGWLPQRVHVRGRVIEMRYRLEGPFLRERAANRSLWLLVVGGATWQAGQREPRRAKREPSFYLISAQHVNGQWALPLPESELLAWLWQRWELEVATAR
jgi:hypothetical protein